MTKPLGTAQCTCGHEAREHTGSGKCARRVMLAGIVSGYCECPGLDVELPAPPEPQTDLCTGCGHELLSHVWDGCEERVIDKWCPCTGFVLPGKTQTA